MSGKHFSVIFETTNDIAVAYEMIYMYTDTHLRSELACPYMPASPGSLPLLSLRLRRPSRTCRGSMVISGSQSWDNWHAFRSPEVATAMALGGRCGVSPRT